MGRVAMYTVLISLVGFVLASYFLLEHGGAQISEVEVHNLHDLTSSASTFDGQVLVTSGRLTYNDRLGRYEISDESANFGVVIHFDETTLASLVGQDIRVSGTFGTGGGVHIDANSVRPAETPVPVGE